MAPDMTMPESTTSRTGRLGPVLLALVFLVALNLRPALTSVGPLLPQVGPELGLSETAEGLLGALPLLAFAGVSPLVHHLSGRLGVERSVLGALLVLAVGAVVRSYAGAGGLWAGTLLVGSAIAVGNVLVPAIVKRDYPRHVSRATSVYSSCITGAASVSSAVAVPLSHVAGWRGALAFWALPPAVVAVAWTTRVRHPPTGGVADGASADEPTGSVWRSPTAWLVTAFMGLQSTTYYTMITWLPTIEVSTGTSARTAGVHLFAYQLVGIGSALAIPRLMRRPDSQVAAAVTASVPMILSATGLALAPGAAVAWALLAGVGSGASLVVALTLIALRGRTHRETTRLSGMAQSVGYLLATFGPLLAGLLGDLTAGWSATLGLIAGLAVLQLLVGTRAGRDRARE